MKREKLKPEEMFRPRPGQKGGIVSYKRLTAEEAIAKYGGSLIIVGNIQRPGAGVASRKETEGK